MIRSLLLLLMLTSPTLAGECYSDDQVAVLGDSTAIGMVGYAMKSTFRGKYIEIPSGWRGFKYPSYSKHPVYGGASSRYVLQQARTFDFRFAKVAIISVGYNDLSIDRDKDGKETIENILGMVKLLRKHEVPRIKIIMPFTSSKRQAKTKFINETKLLVAIRKGLKELVNENPDTTIIFHDRDRARDGLHLSVKGYKALYKRATEC